LWVHGIDAEVSGGIAVAAAAHRQLLLLRLVVNVPKKFISSSGILAVGNVCGGGRRGVYRVSATPLDVRCASARHRAECVQ
jgi:hypothetical protein